MVLAVVKLLLPEIDNLGLLTFVSTSGLFSNLEWLSALPMDNCATILGCLLLLTVDFLLLSVFFLALATGCQVG